MDGWQIDRGWLIDQKCIKLMLTFEYLVSITQLQLPKQYPELTAVTSSDPNKSYMIMFTLS